MSDDQKTLDRLNDLGATLRRQPSVRNDVLRRILEGNATRPAGPSLMRRWWVITGAIAACLLIGLIGINVLLAYSASQAFAAAIDQVARAHTFACRQITQQRGDDGKVVVHESVYMFMEPDRARMQYRNWMGDETVVADYGRKRRLTLIPRDSVADLQDTSDMYKVDPRTGDLVPQALDTDIRDEVLKLTAEAVKDLGVQKRNGKDVRVLQSHGKETVRTVYVDPQTHQPVQIDIEWPKMPQSKFTYTDIRIDEEIDDAQFSLEVPAGYKLFKGGPYVPAKAYYSKMMTKVRSLHMALLLWSNDHDGKFPTDLKELVGAHDMTEQKLAKLVASPDRPNAPAAIVYRPPRAGKDWGTEIVLYESPQQRRDGNVVAGMMDGHAEVTTQARFDELMK
jgi:outer membrane lipoprotein-sorting protein